MIPVMQTKFGDGKGDCFAACIASILEMSIEHVPNFCADVHKNWWQQMLRWLATRGLWAILIDGEVEYPGYWIASGKSPRGDFLHSVVYGGDKLAMDPHPIGCGLDGEVKDSILILPIDIRGYGRD